MQETSRTIQVPICADSAGATPGKLRLLRTMFEMVGPVVDPRDPQHPDWRRSREVAHVKGGLIYAKEIKYFKRGVSHLRGEGDGKGDEAVTPISRAPHQLLSRHFLDTRGSEKPAITLPTRPLAYNAAKRPTFMPEQLPTISMNPHGQYAESAATMLLYDHDLSDGGQRAVQASDLSSVSSFVLWRRSQPDGGRERSTPSLRRIEDCLYEGLAEMTPAYSSMQIEKEARIQVDLRQDLKRMYQLELAEWRLDEQQLHNLELHSYGEPQVEHHTSAFGGLPLIADGRFAAACVSVLRMCIAAIDVDIAACWEVVDLQIAFRLAQTCQARYRRQLVIELTADLFPTLDREQQSELMAIELLPRTGLLLRHYLAKGGVATSQGAQSLSALLSQEALSLMDAPLRLLQTKVQPAAELYVKRIRAPPLITAREQPCRGSVDMGKEAPSLDRSPRSQSKQIIFAPIFGVDLPR